MWDVVGFDNLNVVNIISPAPFTQNNLLLPNVGLPIRIPAIIMSNSNPLTQILFRLIISALPAPLRVVNYVHHEKVHAPK